jgi:hypothetical protein
MPAPKCEMPIGLYHRICDKGVPRCGKPCLMYGRDVPQPPPPIVFCTTEDDPWEHREGCEGHYICQECIDKLGDWRPEKVH